MSSHPGASGDGPVAGRVGVELHVRPNFLLRLGELIRRSDAPCLVPQGLPLRVHLLNQHLQFCLALLPGVGVDAFGVLCAVRPGGRVTALKQLVIDLGDAPGAGLSGLSQHRLEVRGRILLCLCRSLPHLVARPPVDLRRGLGLHVPGDVGVDIQGGGRRHMAQHGGEGLHIHAVFQRQGGKGVPLWHNKDKSENPCSATG